jgi:DNA-binding transcriptional MerR regulator
MSASSVAAPLESDVRAAGLLRRTAMPKPMTIGQLARRTGVSIRALRMYEGLGLIYGLGRSGSNYRLFDESALWCVEVIGALRSLGLTLNEIETVSAVYGERHADPIGPYVNDSLGRALQRIEDRITELSEIRHRIHEYRTTHAAALAGREPLLLYAADPRRQLLQTAS